MVKHIRCWLKQELAEDMVQTARGDFEAEFTLDTAIDAYARLINEVG